MYTAVFKMTETLLCENLYTRIPALKAEQTRARHIQLFPL